MFPRRCWVKVLEEMGILVYRSGLRLLFTMLTLAIITRWLR